MFKSKYLDSEVKKYRKMSFGGPLCLLIGIICSNFTFTHGKGSVAGPRSEAGPEPPHYWPDESSTLGHGQKALVDAPGYVPPEDFVDPDGLTSESNHASPTFDESTKRAVTTQLGQTAYLHCMVNNLGDKTVSWIRRTDFHVLTVGMETYTSDERFEALHTPKTNDWTLSIKYTQLKDSGPYECQVSSDPKISFFVNLTIVEARATIEGAPDIYVKSGSNINLTCVISQSPVPPAFVFWYHDDRMINYDSARGQMIAVQKALEGTALSKLSIRGVQPSDSGNYTCCPSNAEATSITLHVLNGEKPAAMQHDANPGHSLSCSLYSHCIIPILSIFIILILR